MPPAVFWYFAVEGNALKKRESIITAIILAIILAIGWYFFRSARHSALAATSLSNLKMISLAILMYENDNDGIVPDLSTAEKMKQKLMPNYINHEGTFINELNNKPFVFNSNVAGVKLEDIEDPSQVVLVYEDRAVYQHQRAVGFLDGHAKRIDESDWPAIMQKSDEIIATVKARQSAQTDKPMVDKVDIRK